jgi:nucleotide-binding universal stress UspA family protein
MEEQTMKVLLPLDGSELAEVVLKYATELVGMMSLELILLHICKPHVAEMSPVHRAYIQQHISKIAEDAKEAERKQGTDKEFKKVTVRGEIFVGHPAEEIIRYAEKEKVDLILMASHGLSGVKRWALGSIADKVLRAANAPVWLIRPDIPTDIAGDKLSRRNLLIPLDGSRLAESVLPYVKIAAEHRGAENINVTLLMVCQAPVITFNYAGAGIPINTEDVVRNECDYRKEVARKYLESVKARLAKSGISAEIKVIEGRPTEEIIKLADTDPANLIVMATHGRTSSIGKMVYGSFGAVAQRILQEAKSPTLMIRPR